MEKTVVLIKPDGVKKHIIGKVIDYFEKAGLTIVALKLIKLNQKLLDTWYAHHKDKLFFPELSRFMMETPVVAIILEGENAVDKVREIIGPTDSDKAPKGTVRGDYGEGVQRNVVHASDSLERAEFEIELLFKKEEIFN